MAKKPMVRQAYAATLIVKGKEVPPGTPISLEADEAERIAAMFGTVPVADEKPAAPIAKAARDTAQTAVIADLEQALKEAQTAYDEAVAARDKPDANDETAKAFEQAEIALAAAEAELAKALAG